MADLAQSIDLKALHERIQKIDALLSDPHPGLMTWNGFLHGHLTALAKIAVAMPAPTEAQASERAATADSLYLARFPVEARPYCDRAYQDGYEDGRNDENAEDLASAVARLLEELRLIRMKDTGAVYDVLCRIQAEQALSTYREAHA